MTERKPVGAQLPMDTTVTQKKSPAKLGRDIQAKLGQQLRAMYDDVVNQGVPDRFSDLLNRLNDNGDKGQR